jgi:hypothetical protein
MLHDMQALLENTCTQSSGTLQTVWVCHIDGVFRCHLGLVLTMPLPGQGTLTWLGMHAAILLVQ